jgi:glycosyltransferase involved in cell wall biosynthesis
MRIAHIIWALETGGAETMLVDLVNEQVKSEQVTILVVNDMVNKSLACKIDSNCKVRLFGRKLGSKSLIPWIKLNAFLWKYRPDVIHFHLEGMRMMVFYPAPKVFTIHNMHTSGKEYPKYDALYAISDAVKELTKQQGFEATTICNGIHPEKIVEKNDLQEKNLYRLVCVGRLYTPHKGQDILVDALAILRDKGITNFHVDFIGDGESRPELERQIRNLEVDKYVTLVGQKDRSYIYSHLCEYDLYILPSRSEGFGLTVAEAMCAKVPVMVSDLDGPMEVINEGKLGMHFKSEDPVDMASQLAAFIKEGPDAEVIEKAFEYARENFDIKRVAMAYIESYLKFI